MPAKSIPEISWPKRILLVDDEPWVAETMRLVLKKGHYHVEVADSAKMALAMFDPRLYDLVITDYKMPVMDGLELAREIRARHPAQLIILAGGDLAGLPREKGKLANVNALLGKPCSIEEMRTAVAGLFPA